MLRALVPEGQRLPPFYGIAWIQAETMLAVCYPLPLNWLAAFFRDVRFFLKRGPHFRADAYLTGFRKGMDEERLKIRAILAAFAEKQLSVEEFQERLRRELRG